MTQELNDPAEGKCENVHCRDKTTTTDSSAVTSTPAELDEDHVFQRSAPEPRQRREHAHNEPTKTSENNISYVSSARRTLPVNDLEAELHALEGRCNLRFYG